VSTTVVGVISTKTGVRGSVERSVIQFTKKCPWPGRRAGVETRLPAGAAVSAPASLPGLTREN